MVLKALELGDEKLLRNAMQDRLHQKYRKKLIPDYEKIEALIPHHRRGLLPQRRRPHAPVPDP